MGSPTLLVSLKDKVAQLLNAPDLANAFRQIEIWSNTSSPFFVPTGGVIDFTGTTAPDGWLLCDGSSVSRSSYPALFAVIGTTWGSATSATFNLPDLRGRSTLGAGAGPGLTSRALGATGGEENHPLIIAELAPHYHADAGHNHGAATGGESALHTHTPLGVGGSATMLNYSYDGITGAVGFASGRSASGNSGSASSGTESATHTHGVSTDYANIQYTGSGSGHNTMHPFNVLNKIIKT